jgi:adenine-specific DNA methylase
MAIEPGDETTRLVRERGWTHWHHLFNARQLLLHATYGIQSSSPELQLVRAKALDWNSRICHWITDWEKTAAVFYSQALNTFMNYGCRAYTADLNARMATGKTGNQIGSDYEIDCLSAVDVEEPSDLWVTDPPYADAVHYHEITEFFIAWLRKNPPAPFDQWTWDSRRALAIKGSGDDFRRGMVAAYQAMAEHMPDNGMQCVMFTHQDTGVWSDMVSIFWAAGLQVVAAWYIATETTSELKKGGYVQGTVILMLRKRPEGDRAGFKQRILPAVRAEVQRQIESMMHLNEEIKDKHGEPVFNDSDLQMAGYAAALKVLTAYTTIGGEDVTSFALRPRNKGEVTVVDEIVQQAAEAANSLLVPEGLSAETWSRLSGIQRFYLRMMDMETTGASKLDNYQNFAKAFRVQDYARVMGNMKANAARLKRVSEFTSRELTDSTEIGPTWLGHLIIGLQQLLAEVEPQAVIQQFQQDLPDFFEVRPLLIDMLSFMERKAPEATVREVAEVLGARLKNLRALGQ